MFCKNCGNFVADGEAFCGNCGLKVNHPAGYQPINTNTPRPVGAPKPPKKKSKKAVLLIIPVVVIMVVVIAVVAVYKKAADTPLAKIMSAAENMISSSDAYEVSGSFDMVDREFGFSFEGKIQTDIKNGTVALDDANIAEKDNGHVYRYNLKAYYSMNDEIFAYEGGDSDTSDYVYNRDKAYYIDSDLYRTDKMEKSEYRALTNAFASAFSIFNSDLYNDAGNVADNINQLLQEFNLDDIVLEDDFSECLQNFVKDAGKKDFQTEVLGLKSTDNNNYQFEIESEQFFGLLCDYFGSAITIEDYSLEEIIEDSELDKLPAIIKLSIQLNKNIIQDINIDFILEIDDFSDNVEISLHFEKLDKDVTVDTDAIKEKAEG